MAYAITAPLTLKRTVVKPLIGIDWFGIGEIVGSGPGGAGVVGVVVVVVVVVVAATGVTTTSGVEYPNGVVSPILKITPPPAGNSLSTLAGLPPTVMVTDEALLCKSAAPFVRFHRFLSTFSGTNQRTKPVFAGPAFVK